MAKRTVTVEVSTTLEIEIDDEQVSDWDGRTLLTRHENPEYVERGITLEQVLCGVAQYVGIDGRTLDRCDGFADFPEATATSTALWPDWDFGLVTLDGKVVS